MTGFPRGRRIRSGDWVAAEVKYQRRHGGGGLTPPRHLIEMHDCTFTAHSHGTGHVSS
jgi:hypothetical protein